MKGWWVDDCNGPYHTAYCLAFKKATGLSFADKISAPDACALSTEYVDTQERLLIMGQEQGGKYESVSSINVNEQWKKYAAEIGEIITFDYSAGSPQHTNSPFWRGFREACQRQGIPAPRGAAWSNLLKVRLRYT